MEFDIITMTERDRVEVKKMMRTFYSSDAVSTNGSEEIFENDINACINSPYAEGFVFKVGENYLGYAMLAKSYSTEFGKICIWVEDLYLQPNARGLGIGKTFFAFINETFKDCIFRLEVEKENERAVALYEKQGYKYLPYAEMIKL